MVFTISKYKFCYRVSKKIKEKKGVLYKKIQHIWDTKSQENGKTKAQQRLRLSQFVYVYEIDINKNIKFYDCVWIQNIISLLQNEKEIKLFLLSA